MSAARDLFAYGATTPTHVTIWTACVERKPDGKPCGKPAQTKVPAWAKGSYWPALCDACKAERHELDANDPIRMQVAERGIGAVDWEEA